MRKALLIFCLLAFAAQFLHAQARLSVDTVYSTPEDTLYYNNGQNPYIDYTVTIINNGNDAYNGSISLRAYHNGDSGTTEEKDQWVVNNFEVGQTQTVSYRDTVTNSDARYGGGNNIIVIWPHSDSPGVQAPDSSSDDIYIDGLVNVVKREEFIQRVKLWPNPVKDFFNIRYPKDAHKLEYVRIINQLGQVVRQYDKPVTTVPTSKLAKGLFFVEIRYRDGVQGNYRLINQ